MRAEIITIGTELLLGEIVDTNAAHIAKHLAAIGVDYYYTVTVGDNEDCISATLRDALAHADVVIATGGLGPTVDDVTRQAVARATDRELVFHPELLAQIEARFHSLGVAMGENNRRQAYIPPLRSATASSSDGLSRKSCEYGWPTWRWISCGEGC